MLSNAVSTSSTMPLIATEMLSTVLSTAVWIGAVLKLTLISGVDDVVDVLVTLITGETALTTFSAVLFGAAFFVAAFFAGALPEGDFFGAAFFVVVFLAVAFFAGADFLGVDFFFCVAITDIIATRITS